MLRGLNSEKNKRKLVIYFYAEGGRLLEADLIIALLSLRIIYDYSLKSTNLSDGCESHLAID